MFSCNYFLLNICPMSDTKQNQGSENPYQLLNSTAVKRGGRMILISSLALLNECASPYLVTPVLLHWYWTAEGTTKTFCSKDAKNKDSLFS